MCLKAMYELCPFSACMRNQLFPTRSQPLAVSSGLLIAAIAQLAARRSHNPKVVSSILTRRRIDTAGAWTLFLCVCLLLIYICDMYTITHAYMCVHRTHRIEWQLNWLMPCRMCLKGAPGLSIGMRVQRGQAIRARSHTQAGRVTPPKCSDRPSGNA